MILIKTLATDAINRAGKRASNPIATSHPAISPKAAIEKPKETGALNKIPTIAVITRVMLSENFFFIIIYIQMHLSPTLREVF